MERKTYRLSEVTGAASQGGDGGLRCPKCGCRDFRVVETRASGDRINRRRACRHCGHRVTTSERIIGA
jgi:hypothetical protein